MSLCALNSYSILIYIFMPRYCYWQSDISSFCLSALEGVNIMYKLGAPLPGSSTIGSEDSFQLRSLTRVLFILRAIFTNAFDCCLLFGLYESQATLVWTSIVFFFCSEDQFKKSFAPRKIYIIFAPGSYSPLSVPRIESVKWC